MNGKTATAIVAMIFVVVIVATAAANFLYNLRRRA